MELRMESREAMRDGAVAEAKSGHAIRLFPAKEQFSMRSCARCKGLLVNEWYDDLHNTGEHNVEILRCIQCGHRVDSVIVQNQTRPSVERKGARQGRPKSSAKAGVLSEVA